MSLLTLGLGLGLAYFVWTLAGALGEGRTVKAAAAVAALAGLALLWRLESYFLAGRLRLGVDVTADSIALSWIPLALLAFSAPYFNHRVFTPWLNGSPSHTRVLALAAWLVGLALVGSVLLKVLLFGRGSERVISAIDRRAVKLLWGAAVLYFAVFTVLVILAYTWYKGYHSDLGQYNQTLWATLRGSLFYSSLEETSPNSFLGTHVPPFLLTLLPVYALHQSPLTYLILRSLALALAAVPLFYCLRHYTKSGAAALVLAAAYWFHPEIVAQHFSSGYEVVFVAPFFFAAFYFFQRQRFWPFLAFFLLMISVREDFILGGALFGVYALFKRRPKAWIIVPLAVGLLWEAAAIAIFNAYIEHWMFELYYGHFGSSMGEMVKTIVTHPGYALEEVRRLHSNYLYSLLMPLGFFVPVTSLASLFALPNLGFTLTRGQDLTLVAGGISHYSVLVVSAFWLALGSFASRVRRWSGGQERGAVFVAIVIAVLVAGSAHMWAYLLPTGSPADGAALGQAIAAVPPQTSVASNDGRALARLSSRWEVYEPLVWDIPQPPDYLPQGVEQLQADYVLLKPFRREALFNDEGTWAFLTEPDSPYRLIFERDGIKLYMRD